MAKKKFDTTRDLDTGNFNFVLGQHLNRHKIFPGDSFDDWWNLVADIHDHAKDLRERALEELNNRYSEAMDSLCDERDRYSLLEADYDRMRTLWLADIERCRYLFSENETLKLQVAELNKHVEYWTSQYMKASGNQCGAFSAGLYKEVIADLKTQVRGLQSLCDGKRDASERQYQRIVDLEVENETLEKDNSDAAFALKNMTLDRDNYAKEARKLGDRILDLTKKLTTESALATYWHDQCIRYMG